MRVALSRKFLAYFMQLQTHQTVKIDFVPRQWYTKFELKTLIQEYMLLAKEENSIKTYAKFKKEYLYLKSFLTIAGVNLTNIDEIKE